MLKTSTFRENQLSKSDCMDKSYPLKDPVNPFKHLQYMDANFFSYKSYF